MGDIVPENISAASQMQDLRLYQLEHANWRRSKPGSFDGKMVPGGGIEPPTRGFSIRCSTPELPGQAKQGSGLLAALPALVQCRKRFFADQL